MAELFLSRQLDVQSKHYKHQNKVWNKLKLTTKTPERRSGVFTANCEIFLHLF